MRKRNKIRNFIKTQDDQFDIQLDSPLGSPVIAEWLVNIQQNIQAVDGLCAEYMELLGK